MLGKLYCMEISWIKMEEYFSNIAKEFFRIMWFVDTILYSLRAPKSVKPTGIPRRIKVDSTSILRRYVEDHILTIFLVSSSYFFDVISLIKISTSFSCTFYDIILLVEKSTLFWRNFFGVIWLFKKPVLFSQTFSNVISMV